MAAAGVWATGSNWPDLLVTFFLSYFFCGQQVEACVISACRTAKCQLTTASTPAGFSARAKKFRPVKLSGYAEYEAI
jgi:hypothetical protein